ncbi:hypothetical protein N7468_007041 [Penicillium chermesinum]|uniref:Uncharacterized protein n=1 Tax=Penicillium chermesinum TaxID=63820 RepID=A0A9W9TK62_9EURO|nr:uncharacterized protein N7468_007041 [Penicillium chermesinum]KAJ5225816.1 hypothetical protein N7468_007041 [Penicillium chermesinum]
MVGKRQMLPTLSDGSYSAVAAEVKSANYWNRIVVSKPSSDGSPRMVDRISAAPGGTATGVGGTLRSTTDFVSKVSLLHKVVSLDSGFEPSPGFAPLSESDLDPVFYGFAGPTTENC